MERYITLVFTDEAVVVYKRCTVLVLNIVGKQHEFILGRKEYFLPSEGIVESGVATVNTSPQPDRGIPCGMVHCGICKK